MNTAEIIRHSANVHQLNLEAVMPVPEPPIPDDCDLRAFRYMPLDVARLCDSRFAAKVDPAAGFFAIQLWAKAWHQVPAGSLPNDEDELRMLSGCGRNMQLWDSVKSDAMYGWELHADGRYYHKALSEFVLEAYHKLSVQRENGKKGGRPAKNKPTENQQDSPEKTHGFSTANPSQTHGKPREEKGIEENNNPPLPPLSGGDDELEEDDGSKHDDSAKPSKADAELKKLVEQCDCKSVPPGYIFKFAQYRRQIKKPFKTPKGMQSQINTLDSLPDKEAMKAAIEHTMANEWQRIVIPATIAGGKPSARERLIMPNFDMTDGGTALQKWAVKQGFRPAKQGEDGFSYLGAIRQLVAGRNAG